MSRLTALAMYVSKYRVPSTEYRVLPTFLRPQRRMIRHPLLVIAQGHVHEDIAEGGLEADHQCFRVFTGFVAFLRGEQKRGMHAEMKALVVQGRDGIAHNL